MFTGSIFLNLQKVLLRMAPNLNDGLGANKSLYLLPVTVKELQGLEELVVLLLRPALARLSDGVRLPHLLARVLPRPGRIGLRRRRRAGGDHREASGKGSQRCGDGMAASCRPLAWRWRRSVALSVSSCSAAAVRVVAWGVALGGWCWGRAVMWVVAPRVRSGASSVWLRCGGDGVFFPPFSRGARGRGRALVAARAAATAAHLPAVPLALSRSRLACQL